VDDRSSRNSRLGGFHVASPRGRFWGWASWAAEGANHQSFADKQSILRAGIIIFAIRSRTGQCGLHGILLFTKFEVIPIQIIVK
jgi:hypothetical protein